MGGLSGRVFACANGIGLGLFSSPVRSGLPRLLEAGDILSSGGLGDIGTFQRLASSGKSSSDSLYSASKSCVDFLRKVHELVRGGRGSEERFVAGTGRRWVADNRAAGFGVG